MSTQSQMRKSKIYKYWRRRKNKKRLFKGCFIALLLWLFRRETIEILCHFLHYLSSIHNVIRYCSQCLYLCMKVCIFPVLKFIFISLLHWITSWISAELVLFVEIVIATYLCYEDIIQVFTNSSNKIRTIYQNYWLQIKIFLSIQCIKFTSKHRPISNRLKIKIINVWQWRESDGSWKPYSDQHQFKLEELPISKDKSYKFTHPGNQQTYQITKTSKSTAEQVNTLTNYHREVRRVQYQQTMDGVQYPIWWDLSLVDDNDEYDDDINPQYAKTHLIELDLQKSPAKDVVDDFRKTCLNRTVIKVESVQNQMLYDSYWNARNKMIRLIGATNLNERDLYHGTTDLDPMQSIQTEGFRKEFNTISAFGQGTYFARDAQYSVAYSCENDGVFRMFQSKVITGESTLGDLKYKLDSWPRKSDGLMYDSLVDITEGIFVIHEDMRAYPMFIIHFKIPSDIKPIWCWQNRNSWRPYSVRKNMNIEKLKIGDSYEFQWGPRKEKYKIIKLSSTTAKEICINSGSEIAVEKTNAFY